MPGADGATSAGTTAAEIGEDAPDAPEGDAAGVDEVGAADVGKAPSTDTDEPTVVAGPAAVEAERPTGTDEPVDADDRADAEVPAREADPGGVGKAEPEGEGTAEPEGEAAPRTVRLADLRAPVIALVLALVAFALVGVVAFRDHGARERDARAATAAATGSLEQLLSYDYRTIGDQAQKNAGLLTGAFRTEYGTTMEQTIAPVAEKEKAVVQARASEAGVMGQTPDTVTVEVFVNQAKTAEGDDQPSVDQNRVIATMTRVGDRWLISGLSAF